MSSVVVEHLSKTFGAAAALHPTDLSIASGEFIVIIGPSGCGKSTLLRLIAGLERPSAGRIEIGGRDVTAVEPADRGIAMVFQSYALYPHLSVAQNIAFPLRMAKLPKQVIADKVAAVAATLELEALLDRRPSALSGGQRQRVSIARAIVRDPAVLLLDEPLSNLDTALRVRMRHEIARLHQRLGATMIYVTHDQVEAMTLANRIVVMAQGRIEQVGAPLDLYRAPATIRVAAAIGSPAINLLPVRIVQAEPTVVTVALPDGGICRIDAVVPQRAVGGPATLGVRPEHLRPAPDGVFGGRVELFERLGPLSFAHLGHGGDAAHLVAQLPHDRHVGLGETLRFAIAASDALLFDGDGAAYARPRAITP
ncbi:ABC transporter ATP-binding protein [Sphingomonas sp. CARO-RG-8B-R24-01]|uniref:ABC transporter ATP-binding protein n=1 Tax=Sphingomonas sp. CARO-RG-8B-R24-01 TaxID=2914831 RepID=UPI001F586E0D|nr:ABC transporter ATP-binding protein [Sphingomonas sp. CARO-RG-8B-R24-01]